MVAIAELEGAAPVEAVCLAVKDVLFDAVMRPPSVVNPACFKQLQVVCLCRIKWLVQSPKRLGERERESRWTRARPSPLSWRSALRSCSVLERWRRAAVVTLIDVPSGGSDSSSGLCNCIYYCIVVLVPLTDCAR